jgi:hypothetical protein
VVVVLAQQAVVLFMEEQEQVAQEAHLQSLVLQ